MPVRPLEGLHESLITRGLAAALSTLAPSLSERRRVDTADLPSLLARHVAAELERALRQLGDSEKQVGLADTLLASIAAAVAEMGDDDAKVPHPAEQLTAIYRTTPPPRPTTPLSISTLLTRSPKDPALAHEIGREIESADAIDLVAAFITLGGVRAVREPLERFSRRGGKLRVLTTVFTGTTEVEALDALLRLPNVEVRISYDVRRTRLHAKAWLFKRNTGLHAAYIGSANLTATALGSGHEWMVKVCAADQQPMVDKFKGTFDSLWNDAEFEPYDPASEDGRTRLRKALKAETSLQTENVLQLFTLRPFPFQQEILDKLAAERLLHGRRRNLVVAATGTGKTVIAAFDYAAQIGGSAIPPRLLFLAHRRELLEQARTTFRHILRDGAFGELLCDGATPERWEHVFATVQSASAVLDRVSPEHFEHVIIDECHHAPAASYQRVIAFAQPKLLVGLTATPERSDGESLLPDFDGRIAAELRLWHALERQLLVPFEYYGISDNTDLTALRWTRTGYPRDDLAQIYTGNEARVALIVKQLERRVVDVRSIRALAFCVSVEHAQFMAKALTARGIPAAAIHGDTNVDERVAAPRRLRNRELNVLCTCDLYNEGVDLPFVDTLLFLRPTSSATLFLQQLGRGLRLDGRKTSCLVLDFIGQHRTDFRFDDVYTAITNVPRGKLGEAVDKGFPFLPSGCVFELDAVARTQVLEALKRALPTSERLAREIREAARDGVRPSLGEFLVRSGRALDDVYRAKNGWTTLLAKAGLIGAVSEETAAMSRHFEHLLHVDEPARLRTWVEALERPEAIPASEVYRRRISMLDSQLQDRGTLREPVETARYLARDPAIRAELRELAEVLQDRIDIAEERYPVKEWPVALHHHYSRREVMAAIGYVTPGKKKLKLQTGILKLEDERRELLFITLDKSASSFSPTTRYRDYAISPSLFHWETQSRASVERESGRRYTESATNGWSFYLFVRETTDSPEEYAFLGRARLKAFSGDRPIAVTWELESAMPAGLFERFATLAQG